MNKPLQTLRRATSNWSSAAAAAITAVLAGCSAPSPSPAPAPGPSAAPASSAAAGTTSRPGVPAPAPLPPPKISTATSPRDYRRDGARHVYERNASRIWQGKLQPNLYAIGVLEVHLDRQGRVTGLHWMRAPKHAPEVVAEIEAIVQAASPFPPPSRLGRVTYTDTWLWDKSGQFQLDTLTEGQL